MVVKDEAGGDHKRIKKKYCPLPGQSEETQEKFRIDGVPTEIFIFINLYITYKYDI
jgi:hypothetical protein